MHTESRTWFHYSSATGTNTRWGRLLFGAARWLYRCTALRAELLAGYVIAARCTGCHEFSISSLLLLRVVRSRALAGSKSTNERKRNGSRFEARMSSTPEFVGLKVWETLLRLLHRRMVRVQAHPEPPGYIQERSQLQCSTVWRVCLFSSPLALLNTPPALFRPLSSVAEETIDSRFDSRKPAIPSKLLEIP